MPHTIENEASDRDGESVVGALPTPSDQQGQVRASDPSTSAPVVASRSPSQLPQSSMPQSPQPSPSDDVPERVLLVDDDPSLAQALFAPLARHGVKLSWAIDVDTAMSKYNAEDFDVVIVELDFKPVSGLTLIQKWKMHTVMEKRQVGIIAIAGKTRQSGEDALLRELGNIDMISKPFSVAQLLPHLAVALKAHRRLAKQNLQRERILAYKNGGGSTGDSMSILREQIASLGNSGIDLLLDLCDQTESFQDGLAILESLERTLSQPNAAGATPSPNLALYNAKAKLLLKLGRYEEARVCFEKLDTVAPNNIDRIQDMVTLYLQLKMPDQSVEKMKNLVKLCQDEPDLKFEMFGKLCDFGFDEHAQEFCRESTRPIEIVRYYNNKGVLLSKFGDPLTAIKEYEKALLYFPKFKENFKIHFNLALSYVVSHLPDDLEQGQKHLEKCITLNPQFLKAQSTLQTVKRHQAKRSAAAATPASKSTSKDEFSQGADATPPTSSQGRVGPKKDSDFISPVFNDSIFGDDEDDDFMDEGLPGLRKHS